MVVTGTRYFSSSSSSKRVLNNNGMVNKNILKARKKIPLCEPPLTIFPNIYDEQTKIKNKNESTVASEQVENETAIKSKNFNPFRRLKKDQQNVTEITCEKPVEMKKLDKEVFRHSFLFKIIFDFLICFIFLAV